MYSFHIEKDERGYVLFVIVPAMAGDYEYRLGSILHQQYVGPFKPNPHQLLLGLRAMRFSADSALLPILDQFIQEIAAAYDLESGFLPSLSWRHDVIKALIPHRGDKLLLDEVLEINPGKSATGLLRVTEKHCEGHFGVFRGVDRIEAINLLGAVALKASEEYSDFDALLWGYSGPLETHRIAKPGDILDLSVTITGSREERVGKIITGRGSASVRGKEVCVVNGLECLLVPSK